MDGPTIIMWLKSANPFKSRGSGETHQNPRWEIFTHSEKKGLFQGIRNRAY